MRSYNHGRIQQQASFLRRQFLQDGDLPFTNVLSEGIVSQALTAMEVVWLDRIYSPLVTLWLFLGQVLNADSSCRAAVWRRPLADGCQLVELPGASDLRRRRDDRPTRRTYCHPLLGRLDHSPAHRAVRADYQQRRRAAGGRGRRHDQWAAVNYQWSPYEQAGGTLTVNGAVDPGVAVLRALAGSTLNVPGLTSINTANTAATNYSAQGAGGKLDLSSVTTFTGSASTSTTTVTAITGGRVEMENVPSITSGSVFLVADGASSVIALTALTTVKSDNQFTRSLLSTVAGGTLITTNLATIERAVVNVSNASTINLAALTSANDSSFRALQGAQVAVPNLTSYVAGPGGTEFFATSLGSTLDLSHITSMSGASSSSMTIATSDRGFLNLSGLTTITSGVVNLAASGNSVIDLSSLAAYSASNSAQVRRLRAETGGTIHLRTGGPTTITNARVELEPTGHIDGDRLELGADAVFAANGTLNADLANNAGTVAV